MKEKILLLFLLFIVPITEGARVYPSTIIMTNINNSNTTIINVNASGNISNQSLYTSSNVQFNTVTVVDSMTIGIGAAGVDYPFNFDGETNNGVFRWKEDEDYFQFDDSINFLFSGKFIDWGAGGNLRITGDTVNNKMTLESPDEIQMDTSLYDLNGDFLDANINSVVDFDVPMLSYSNSVPEINISSNRMTFNNGATDTHFSWDVNGVLQFDVGSSTGEEIRMAANRMTFNNGANDGYIDWTTSGKLVLGFSSTTGNVTIEDNLTVAKNIDAKTIKSRKTLIGGVQPSLRNGTGTNITFNSFKELNDTSFSGDLTDKYLQNNGTHWVASDAVTSASISIMIADNYNQSTHTYSSTTNGLYNLSLSSFASSGVVVQATGFCGGAAGINFMSWQIDLYNCSGTVVQQTFCEAETQVFDFNQYETDWSIIYRATNGATNNCWYLKLSEIAGAQTAVIKGMYLFRVDGLP